MKYYLVTTLVCFALVFLAHVARAYQEGLRIFGEPVFLLTSILSIGLAIWAIVLLKKC
jgi:hypothetical protein